MWQSGNVAKWHKMIQGILFNSKIIVTLHSEMMSIIQCYHKLTHAGLK